MKIAIASGKGGTGKTLIATNLAALLSQTAPTLLVDLDVEEPNASLFISGSTTQQRDQFKMIPVWDEGLCNLCGKCADTCRFHALIQLGTFISVFHELCHSCYACSGLCPSGALPMRGHKIGETRTQVSGMLTLVESRLEIGEEQAVPLIHKTHQLIDKEFNNFPVQVFDCPPGTSCPVVAACRNADFVVLVTEPTPFGLNDLKLAVESMQQLNKRVGVVINRYGIGNQDTEAFCREAGIPILARVPYHREIAEWYSRGELVFDKLEGMAGPLRQIMQHIHQAVPSHA